MNELKTFAEELKKQRKAHKLTQAQLADMVGVSLMTMRRYESGESAPDMGTLIALCGYLHSDQLLNVWGLKRRAEGETSDERIRRFHSFEFVKDVLKQQYWKDLVVDGNWEFISLLVETATIYQKMNETGIRKAISFITELSKVPEYQSQNVWAFVEKSQLESSTDDETEK